MNRAERRKMVKKKLTHSELKYLTDQESKIAAEKATDRAVRFTVKVYSAAVALTLKDKLGYGEIRAKRFMEDVQELFDNITDGYLSLDDVVKTVEEELLIRIR